MSDVYVEGRVLGRAIGRWHKDPECWTIPKNKKGKRRTIATTYEQAMDYGRHSCPYCAAPQPRCCVEGHQ